MDSILQKTQKCLDPFTRACGDLGQRAHNHNDFSSMSGLGYLGCGLAAFVGYYFVSQAALERGYGKFASLALPIPIFAAAAIFLSHLLVDGKESVTQPEAWGHAITETGNTINGFIDGGKIVANSVLPAQNAPENAPSGKRLNIAPLQP